MNLRGPLLALSLACSPLIAQTPGYQWSNFVGLPGGVGNADATGSIARFSGPSGVTVDSSGNVYVADTGNAAIREITPTGTATTYVGYTEVSGTTNATGSAARFFNPKGVAFDSAGNLYVADTSNQEIRKVTPAGVVTTFAGGTQSAGNLDGTGTAARFNNPQGLTVDANGNVFVADTGNHTIREITPGGVVTTVAGTGSAGFSNGTGTAAIFHSPTGIVVDANDNLYVADSGNHCLRLITSSLVVSTLAGSPGVSGHADGTGTAASFNTPSGVTLDTSGNIDVADTNNSTIRQITTGGVVTTLAGLAGSSSAVDGTGSSARFFNPLSITADRSGNLYVADTNNQTIRRIAPGAVVTTLAGLALNRGNANGTGTAARFNTPDGAVVDSSGNLYVSENQNHVIRKITPAGVVTTFAGTMGVTGTANGTGTAAQFNHPAELAIDSNNNIYVADQGNQLIRMVTVPGAVVSTIAGTAGVTGSANGTPGTFNNPRGIGVDASGNLYVADTGNQLIRKIAPGGTVSTFAGTAGTAGSANGTGTAATFNSPWTVAVTPAQNIIVADSGNDTLRMITPAGVVTTLAGQTGVYGGTDGADLSASFWTPNGLAVDSAGYIYVADKNSQLVRKLTPESNVGTIGGAAHFGSSGDGIGVNAWFSGPTAVAVSSAGLVYLVDANNNRISVGTPQAPLLQTLAATAIGTTTATINASVNPNGNASTVWFDYGATNSYGSTQSITISPTDDLATHGVSFGVTGLQPSSTYHFRVRATNSAGTANGSDLTFTTINAPEIAVEQPAGNALTTGVSSVSFGSVVAGNVTSLTFTIRNTGSGNLTSFAFSIDGANASDFTANTSSLPASLAPGASATFTVAFAPPVSGNRAATLHINSTDPTKNPFNIALSGAGALPTGWTSADIGAPSPAGSVVYDSTTGQYSVAGGGNFNVSAPNTNDQFQYTYQQVTGNFVATVKLSSVSDVTASPGQSPAPDAGLMLRKSLDPQSAYTMVGASNLSSHRSAEFWRVHDHDQPRISYDYGSITFPLWVRIYRWGDNLHMQISEDNVNWAEDSGLIIDGLPNTLYIGLAAASRDTGNTTTGVFSNFSVQPLNLTHQSSWIANSFGGAYWSKHVMNAVADMAVDNATGILVTGGEDEARDLHIYDINGGFNYWGDTNHVRALAIDGTYIYTVGDGNLQKWRYDGVLVTQNTLGGDKPTGVAVVGSNLYVADPTTQTIRVFDCATLTENTAAAFAVTNALRVVNDGSGALWITQHNTSGAPDAVLHCSTTGAALSGQITLFNGSVVAGICVRADNGLIYVADRGPLQQIHVFNSSGVYQTSVGASGGIYSSAFGTIPGQPNPMKFNSPTCVAFDSSANMYVGCAGASNQWTSGSGTEMRKFDSNNNQIWERLGLTYVDSADPVAGTDGTQVYTQNRRFTLDYTKPLGQQWTYAGYTFDPFTYPGDARATQSQPAGATVRFIGGQKILYVSSMDATWIAMYRFQPGSEIAIPCGLIERETDRGKPDNTFYIWVDANGNGAIDPGEVDTSLPAQSQIWGFTIDKNGGLWAADKSTYRIRYYPCKGLNAIGAPAYGPQYAGASEQDWPAPSDFVGSSTVYPLRPVYSTDDDVLFIGGYRAGNPEQFWDWKGVGSCVGCYSGWLAGSQSKTWLTDVPYQPNIALISDTKNGHSAVGCMTFEGDYLFLTYQPTLDVFVYNRYTGAYVQTLDAGPEICGNDAIEDIVTGTSAVRRSNGEYDIWIEDDAIARINMYQWVAPNNAQIDVEQPTNTPLTSGGAVAFGTILLGGNSSRTFTVRNIGSTSLFGLNLSIDGANAGDFVPSSNVSSIAPGQTATFTVTFSPGGESNRSAFLHIISNDPQTPSFNLSLTGNGITALDNWRQTWFGTIINAENAADTADPYHTGVSNLEVFAFLGPNQNPALAAPHLLPQPQMSGGNLFYSFTQPAGVSGVTYGAQWSATLQNDWQPISDTGSGTQHLFSVPMGSNKKLFIRLEVSEP